jgi:hypothetical protein
VSAATKAWVLNQWADLKSDFAEILAGVADVFRDGWAAVMALTPQWVTDFLAIGGQIVEGLKQGIKNKWTEMTAWFDGLLQGMIAGARAIFDSHSPSRVFTDIGEDVTQGLANGLANGTSAVEGAMAGVVGAVAGASGSLAIALEEVNDWGRSTFAGLLAGTTDFASALDQLRIKLIETFANEAWDSLMTALFGSASSGGLFDAIFGGASAMGNVFSGGRIVPFANGGVIAAPTLFPMAGSQIGLMGEAGPEAIMPLTRGTDGKLGVRAEGVGGGGQMVINQVFQTGVAQTVRAEMMGLMPAMKEEILGAVRQFGRRNATGLS